MWQLDGFKNQFRYEQALSTHNIVMRTYSMSGVSRFVVPTILAHLLPHFEIDFCHFCTKFKSLKPTDNNILAETYRVPL